jgi:hypothetical protein
MLQSSAVRTDQEDVPSYIFHLEREQVVLHGNKLHLELNLFISSESDQHRDPYLSDIDIPSKTLILQYLPTQLGRSRYKQECVHQWPGG